MSADAFIKLEGPAIEAVLKDVNPLIEGSRYEAETVTVLAQPLLFYPDHNLLDIADHVVIPLKRRFVVHGPGRAVVLDGTNQPIYRMNAEIPLMLNAENIISYVRFFFSHVRGRHGRFVIAENVDALAWKEDPPPAARKAMGHMLAPVELTDVDDGGSFHLTAHIMFRESLFKTGIRVDPNGLVRLGNEELLIEEMPVFDSLYNQ